MQEYGFHLTRILWCNNRILDSVLIRENTGQWKLVYPHFKPTKSPLCFIVLLIILPEYNLSSRKWTKNIFTLDLLVKGTVFYQTSKERKELNIFILSLTTKEDIEALLKKPYSSINYISFIKIKIIFALTEFFCALVDLVPRCPSENIYSIIKKDLCLYFLTL